MSENDEKNEGTITLKKDSLWKIATFVFAVLFVISLITGGFSGSDNAGATGNVVADAGGDSGNIKVQINDDDPVLGNPEATVSIVEFSDFQCPFCSRAEYDALADFKASDYFANGEVNLIYKHFPLTSIHQYAQQSAEASECAGAQGKFWEYHDTLFANQDALDTASLKQYAADLGLDTDAFNSCLDNGDARSGVSQDVAQATAAGARGTPYFVVLNKDTGATQVVSGAVPYANFEAAINVVQ